MLQAVAVIFKRGTVETKAKGREGLFNDVSQLIGSGDSALVSQQFKQGQKFATKFENPFGFFQGNLARILGFSLYNFLWYTEIFMKIH